ncbi:MAG TPA: NRDE family protein [Alphaproteobacteria bacterium]|nr:NRDE family protein [Alphaproteobacteria bacterium]
MCTLIVYYKLVTDYPIIVAANRDEYYARIARGPHVLHHHPRVYAGKDEKAGGTWLGTNEYGLVVGLVNRHSTLPQDAARRSRGLLCLDLLRQKDAKAAKDFLVADAAMHQYNSFYVLWADDEHAYVAYNEGELTIRDLYPGRYMLTNSSLIDLAVVTPTGLGDLLTEPPAGAAPDLLLGKLAEACKTHHEIERVVDPPNEHRGNRALCVHASEQYGTVSSSLLAIGREFSTSRYFHAEGAPCQTPYRDFSGLLTGSAEVRNDGYP